HYFSKNPGDAFRQQRGSCPKKKQKETAELKGEDFMKSLRLSMAVVLVSFSTLAFAQSKAASPQSDAQKSFTVLKSLAGTWQGAASTEPNTSDEGGPVLVTMRVTSRGNALAHEMKDAKASDDPNKFDHPLTTF